MCPTQVVVVIFLWTLLPDLFPICLRQFKLNVFLLLFSLFESAVWSFLACSFYLITDFHAPPSPPLHVMPGPTSVTVGQAAGPHTPKCKLTGTTPVVRSTTGLQKTSSTLYIFFSVQNDGDQCDSCGNLLNPTDLINPKCKLTGTMPVVRSTARLPKKQHFIPLLLCAGCRGDQCDSCGNLLNSTDLNNPKCKLAGTTPVVRSTTGSQTNTALYNNVSDLSFSMQDARGDQCDSCGNLLNPTDLINPKCKLTGTTPVLRTTKHIFLDLPKLSPQLQAYITDTSSKGGWSNNCVQVMPCPAKCPALPCSAQCPALPCPVPCPALPSILPCPAKCPALPCQVPCPTLPWRQTSGSTAMPCAWAGCCPCMRANLRACVCACVLVALPFAFAVLSLSAMLHSHGSR